MPLQAVQVAVDAGKVYILEVPHFFFTYEWLSWGTGVIQSTQ